jgi:hypothetical protein
MEEDRREQIESPEPAKTPGWFDLWAGWAALTTVG